MKAPVKELQQMQQLQQQARQHLEAGHAAEALGAVQAALALEETNLRSLTLKVEALEALGRTDEAGKLRTLVRQLRREAWQRDVEAEIRGHHDLMGEAIRHENY